MEPATSADRPRPMVLSLGDSFSCGEGVGVSLDTSSTWAGLMAEALGAEHRILAVAGATTAQVREVQLPIALAQAPAFVTVLAGLNDVFRAGFDEARIRRDVGTVVAQLHERHRGVLLVRLHDPTAILPFPAWLRRALQARIAAVNDAIEAAVVPGVAVLDLRSVDRLRLREAWAVDRLHPSAFGHAVIAAALARISPPWWSEAEVPCPETGIAPSGVAECRWVLGHGLPWVVRRARMLTGVLSTLVTEPVAPQ